MDNLHITADIYQPVLLQYKVEKLADHRQTNQGKIASLNEWQPTETSTVEAYIEGGLRFTVSGASLQMPFATPFLFTCTKEESSRCRLAWSQSLS